MDFKAILDKWEKGQKQTQSKVMEKWLSNNEVYDKDAHAQKDAVPEKNRRNLRGKKPDDILDIHGFTRDKAWLSLDAFFSRAKNCGYEKLRIIHGKGNHSQKEAVLKETVRAFIEKCPYAGESSYEKVQDGGTGATWVLLK